jgi:hypothetical protein
MVNPFAMVGSGGLANLFLQHLVPEAEAPARGWTCSTLQPARLPAGG